MTEITKCVCSDNCTEIIVEFDRLEVVNRSYNITSLTFDPNAGGLTYSDGVATFSGEFKYRTLEEPEKEVVASGSVTFNIKALDNIVLDSDEENNALELHLDQEFIKRVTMLEADKADVEALNETNELLDQVQKAQAADSIAIVGLQSDVITVKQNLDRVEALAKGKSGGQVFADYEELVATVGSKNNIAYIVGQNFLIETLEVPDLWVSAILPTKVEFEYTTDKAITDLLTENGYIEVGYYKLSTLETRKIDTAEFLKKSGTYQYMKGEFILNNAQITVLQEGLGSKIRNANNDVYRYTDENENVFGNREERTYIETADDLYVNGTPILEKLNNVDVPFATKDVAGKIYIWEEGDTLYIKNTDGPIVFKDFSKNTPATIAWVSNEIAVNNMTSAQVEETYGWKIGDKIGITLTTGEDIEMQIIGFNHDDKSDGSGKAGITLQMADCLATRYYMNDSNTNAGGYAASAMKTSILPAFKALLPQEWQNIIKLVDKKSANGGGSNYSETLTLSEDLFLLCTKEVLGTGTNARDGENEGSWYEYYETNNTADARIKKCDDNADGIVDTAGNWWLRSSNNNYGSSFLSVNSSGGVSSSASSSEFFVSFAFCI